MKNITQFDLLQTATAAAQKALGEQPLSIQKIKLAAFTGAGHAEQDWHDWEAFFTDRLQTFAALSQRPARSTAAAQSEAAAQLTNPANPAGKVLALLLVFCFLLLGTKPCRAGISMLTGSGPTVGALQTTNFSTLVQIGTFSFSPQNVFFSTGNGPGYGTTNFFAYGRMTFDGTNFFFLPQYYSNWNNANTLLTNAQWSLTNNAYPIYATLSVSNGMTYPITNFQAGLQF